KVDFDAVDFATIVARRAQNSPPGQGDRHMYLTSYYGVDFADPTHRFLRADGNESSNGWANNPQIEVAIAAWRNATSLDEEKRIGRRLNRLAVDVVCAPLGAYLLHSAWRNNVSGIVPAPLPLSGGEQDRV